MNNISEPGTPGKAPLKTLIKARSILKNFNYRYETLRNTNFGQNILSALNNLFVNKQYLDIVHDFTEASQLKDHNKIKKSVEKLITFFNITGYTDKELPHILIKSLINLRNVENKDLFGYIDGDLKALAVYAGASQLGIFLLEMMGTDVKAAYSPSRHFIVLYLPKFSFGTFFTGLRSRPVLFIDFTSGRAINADLSKNYRLIKKVYMLKDEKQNINSNYDSFHFENERRFSPAISNIVIKGYFNKEKKQSEPVELIVEHKKETERYDEERDSIDYNEIWKRGERHVEEARQAIDKYEKYILQVISGFSDKEFLKEINNLKNILDKVWNFTHTLNDAELSGKNTAIQGILTTLKNDLSGIGREVIYLEAFITNALRKEKDRYSSALEKLKNLPVEKEVDQEKLDELEYLEARFSDTCGIVSKMGRLFTPDLPTDYFDFEKIGEIISNIENSITKAKSEILQKKNEALVVFSETFKYPLNPETHEEVIDHSIRKLLQHGCGYSVKGKIPTPEDDVRLNMDISALIKLTTVFLPSSAVASMSF
jgi:hypothetical protein